MPRRKLTHQLTYLAPTAAIATTNNNSATATVYHNIRLDQLAAAAAAERILSLRLWLAHISPNANANFVGSRLTDCQPSFSRAKGSEARKSASKWRPKAGWPVSNPIQPPCRRVGSKSASLQEWTHHETIISSPKANRSETVLPKRAIKPLAGSCTKWPRLSFGSRRQPM